MVFVGGLTFHFMILQPALGRSSSPEVLGIAQRVERRFKTIRWLSLLVLLGTGFLNLLREGDSPRIESVYGGILMIKLFLVLVTLGLMGLYDFALMPRPNANPSRARLAMGIALLLVNLAILFVAVYLTRL